MVPKHLQPFPPGAQVRLIRGGDPKWEGYATGGFVRLSRKSELQVQVYWVHRVERVNLGTEKEPLWEKVQLGGAPVFGNAGEIDKTTTEYVSNLELVNDTEYRVHPVEGGGLPITITHTGGGKWVVQSDKYSVEQWHVERKLPRYILKGYMAVGVRYSIGRR